MSENIMDPASISEDWQEDMPSQTNLSIETDSLEEAPPPPPYCEETFRRQSRVVEEYVIREGDVSESENVEEEHALVSQPTQHHPEAEENIPVQVESRRSISIISDLSTGRSSYRETSTILSEEKLVVPVRESAKNNSSMIHGATSTGYPSASAKLRENSSSEPESSHITPEAMPLQRAIRSSVSHSPGAVAIRGPAYDEEQPDSREFQSSAATQHEGLAIASNNEDSVRTASAGSTSAGSEASAQALNRDASDGVVSAARVNDAETIVYAKSVNKDRSRRNLLLILGGASAVVLAVALSLSLTLTSQSSGDDGRDPRCRQPFKERDLAVECLCEGTAQREVDILSESDYAIYEAFASILRQNGALDPTFEFELHECIPENLSLLQMTRTARRDRVEDRLPENSQSPSFVNYLLQAYGLLHLFFSMGGVNWDLPVSWLSGDHRSSIGYTGVRYLFIDNVERIELPVNNLKGSIPSTIGLFTSLRVLDFNGNTGISGTLPSEMARLTALSELKLAHTNMPGPIPSVLQYLTRLDVLDLSKTGLTGRLPSVGDGMLIRMLDLSLNELTGAIPSSFGEMNRLKSLRLNDNQLSGTIPDSFVALTHLELIDLGFNRMSGGLPDFLANITTLEFGSFIDSGFSGSVPENFCQPLVRGPYGGQVKQVIVTCDENEAINISTCPCCTVEGSSNSFPMNLDDSWSDRQVRLICSNELPIELLERAGVQTDGS